jgi:nicotinamidase-related amidase
MHSRFDQFRKTELGGQLEALIDSGDRYIEFAALSRAGVAAIAAIVDDVKEKFPELATDITARQFCGAMVAEVMRRNKHQVVRPRGRVSGGIFAYGAVFTPRPVALSFADRVVHLRATPRQLADRIRAFPEPVWTRRPEGTGFSVVEHLCHLRDLNVIAGERIRLVVTLKLPPLSSGDGTALAMQRAYQKQDAKAALSALTSLRSERVVRIVTAAREGGFRFFSRQLSLPTEAAGASQIRTAMAWQRKVKAEDIRPSFPRGSPQSQIIPALTPLESEVIFDKLGMSFFVGTPLEMVLRDCAISAVAIVGVVLEVGIKPMVRHAAALGLLPVLMTIRMCETAQSAGIVHYYPPIFPTDSSGTPELNRPPFLLHIYCRCFRGS